VSAPRIACIIPALNAAATLQGVIAGLRVALPGALVTVIDDGSRDDTRRIARACSDVTIPFDRNRGKGAALRAGFAAATADDAELVITIDADGQHDTTFAASLVRALASADVAIGARDRRSPAMPMGRRLTNSLSAAAIARCIGQRVPDAQSGYRAVRAEVLRRIAPRGDRYEFETEFLILAARCGYRIDYVPVPTWYPATVRSQFRTIRDSARIVGTLWRYGMGAHH